MPFGWTQSSTAALKVVGVSAKETFDGSLCQGLTAHGEEF